LTVGNPVAPTYILLILAPSLVTRLSLSAFAFDLRTSHRPWSRNSHWRRHGALGHVHVVQVHAKMRYNIAVW